MTVARAQTEPNLYAYHARPLAAGPPSAILARLADLLPLVRDLARRRSSTPPEPGTADSDRPPAMDAE